MDRSHRNTDDAHLTLRIPRLGVALVVALLLHGAAWFLQSLLPIATKVREPIEIALVTPAPATSPTPAVAAPPARREPNRAKKRASPPPSTSPVVPELPPSSEEERAQLPVAEKSPEPAPPPEPTSWKDRLKQQLAATRPTAAKLPSGVLAPSYSTLDRVAAADPALHDEETERRMMQDFGPFFRRGLEALRSNWHPSEVLRAAELDQSDPTRRCGRSRERTTFAVAVLNRTGTVVDVVLKNPSGCPDLDDEAIAAFKRVAQFPHPPAGIFVSPDGTERETARYPVRFIVTFDGGIRLDWSRS